MRSNFAGAAVWMCGKIVEAVGIGLWLHLKHTAAQLRAFQFPEYDHASYLQIGPETVYGHLGSNPCSFPRESHEQLRV